MDTIQETIQNNLLPFESSDLFIFLKMRKLQNGAKIIYAILIPKFGIRAL